MKDSSYSEMKDKFKNKNNNVHDFEIFEPAWKNLNDSIPEEQTWFWPDLIPAKTASIFTGSGGIGKSLVLLNIIAHTTSGKELNCCGHKILFPQGSVILMSAEGSDNIAVTPKLIAMEAVLSRVHTIIHKKGAISHRKRLIQLDEDLTMLEQKIIELQTTDNPVKLIVIDPITYFMGKVKDHIQKDVCEIILQFCELAEKYNLTLIFNKHRRKQSSGASFTELADEVGGAAAWVNTPRQAIGFIKHPTDDDQFLMASIKSNVNPNKSECFSYTIKPVSIFHQSKEIKTIKIAWGTKMESLNINYASNKETFNKTKSEQCSDIIYSYLKEHGVTSMKRVIEICQKSNINDRLRQRVIQKMLKEHEIVNVPGNTIPHIKLKDFEEIV